MRVDSTASDLMSILQKKNERSDADPNNVGEFSSMLKQILNNGNLIKETPTGDLLATVKRELYVPKTTFTKYAHTPYDEDIYWRKENEYDSFLNSCKGSKAEYATDMWEVDSTGEKKLNKKGQEHFHQWRIGRLQPMKPDSIEDATQRFKSGREHLNNYIHTMFEENGIEFDFIYEHTAQPESGRTWIQYFYNKIGMSDWEGNAKKVRDFLGSESGMDMESMMEEVQFYGAISELASINPSFNNAYNKDSEAALIDYADDISNTMNTIILPKVQTAPNLYHQLLQTGF